MNQSNQKGKKTILLFILAVTFGSSAAISETVRLRPSNSTSEGLTASSLQSTNSNDALLKEAETLREQGFSDKEKVVRLQDQLREAYKALEKESTKAEYRQQGLNGEIKISEWRLHPTTLRENMMTWRSQAEQLTKQDIPFVWELPGPVPLEIPAIFYGTWRDALWQLSLAFKENGWDISIDVAKANNAVIFRSFIN